MQGLMDPAVDLSGKKREMSTRRVPALPQPDLPAQNGLAKRLLSKLAAEIKDLFISEEHCGLIQTAPDRTATQWVQNYERNQERSPLYRLPPELLFRIVEKADRVTRHIMRRTCKIFLAVIGDGDICELESIRRGNPARQVVPWVCPRYGLNNQGSIWGRLVWPVHEPPRSQKGKDQLANLLARDRGRRCDACSEYQKNGQVEKTLWRLRHPLWCSGCERKHPLLFFSA